MDFKSCLGAYSARLKVAIDLLPVDKIEQLANDLNQSRDTGAEVFFMGNGGSAGNAVHLVNDLIYGVASKERCGIRAHALPANTAMITCLANDEGYPYIFSHQLKVLAKRGDIAILCSGSGNSANIIEALRYCRSNQIKSYAVLGYDGGEAKHLADTAIHVPVDDMQISEDIQLIVGHILMQWLRDGI